MKNDLEKEIARIIGCNANIVAPAEDVSPWITNASDLADQIAALYTQPAPADDAAVAWAEVFGRKVTAVRLDKSFHCTEPLTFLQPAKAVDVEAIKRLTEALRNLREANMSYSLVSNAKNARCLEQCMRDADAALLRDSNASSDKGDLT